MSRNEFPDRQHTQIATVSEHLISAMNMKYKLLAARMGITGRRRCVPERSPLDKEIKRLSALTDFLSTHLNNLLRKKIEGPTRAIKKKTHKAKVRVSQKNE
jgi:hypothetical protein